ncbi:hypothetical protein MBLNU457_4526t1 [Dothideomycetes sp. NU457]
MASARPHRPRAYTADGFIRLQLSIMSPFVPAIVKRQVSKFELMQRISAPNNICPASDRSQERCSRATGQRTPPPAYDDTLSPLASSTVDKNIAVESTSTSTASAAAIAAANAFQEQDPSSIQWKYGGQGLNLLTLSAQESPSDTTFSRQLYIHSLTYLLRGLPSTLTNDEQGSLNAALPHSLRPSPPDATAQSDRRTERSLLHRVVSRVIFNIFMLVTYVIPHLQTLLAAAYTYEREHQVSKKLFARTVDAADAIGRLSRVVFNSFCGLDGGKVGKAIEGVLLWWINGVCGGVQEGVGNGLREMGVEANRKGKRRHD